MLNLAIFLTLAAGLLIFLKWFVRNELLDPVFISSAYWIVFILFSLFLSVKMNFVFYWIGVLPIILLLIAFAIGGFVMKHLLQHITINEADDKKTKSVGSLSTKRIKWLILVFSAMGIVAIYIQLDFLQIKISSFSDLLYAANKISVIRYSEGEDMPKSGLILMAFLFSGGFFGGIYSVVTKGLLNTFISIFPFLVMLVSAFINGVKTGILFLLVIWVSGFAAAYVYEKKGEMKKMGRMIMRACIIVMLVILLIPITQLLRGGRSDVKINFVNAGALSYFCSFNAFTIWYNSYNNNELAWGKYSLSGIHNFFYGDRQIGLYGDNNIEVGKYDNNPIRTNVYTMTRGLIQDFTLFGAMAILFLTGIIMQLVYFCALRRNINAMGILALFYSILFWSFTANLINYNTLILSWIISLGNIFFIKKQEKTIRQATAD